MDAQTFHDINQVLAALNKHITHARYGGRQHGMCNPNDIHSVVTDVNDAAATLNALVANGKRALTA